MILLEVFVQRRRLLGKAGFVVEAGRHKIRDEAKVEVTAGGHN
jgi:hypothetical protein